MMFRKLKRLLFNFRIIERRITKNAQCAIIFENGIGSDYFNWIETVVPDEVDIIQLGLTPILFGSLISQAEVSWLLRYENLFFHSPGEELQANLISVLSESNYNGNIVGLQHGFVGETPPSGLASVLKASKSAFYISFELAFSQHLELHSDAKIIEYLLKKPELSRVEEYPSNLDCYFDAPDKGTLFKNASQLSKLLLDNSIELVSLKFHPATSSIKKILVYFYLWRHLGLDRSKSSKSAVCWDSKIKYDLFANGRHLYTFDDNNQFSMIFLSHDSVDFGDHVKLAVEQILKNGI